MEVPRLLWRNILPATFPAHHGTTPIATSPGISQPHHPGTDFPSNKVDLSLHHVVEMVQSSWPVGISNFEALSTETMIRENAY